MRILLFKGCMVLGTILLLGIVTMAMLWPLVFSFSALRPSEVGWLYTISATSSALLILSCQIGALGLIVVNVIKAAKRNSHDEHGSYVDHLGRTHHHHVVRSDDDDVQ